jgi:hypothetical protein
MRARKLATLVPYFTLSTLLRFLITHTMVGYEYQPWTTSFPYGELLSEVIEHHHPACPTSLPDVEKELSVQDCYQRLLQALSPNRHPYGSLVSFITGDLKHQVCNLD